jgi:hypothetical protein
MHDIDRTRQEMERGLDALETVGFETGSYETNEFGFGAQETGGVFGETQEMALAAELLELTNEQELNQFIGDLIKGAGKAIGGFVKGPVGQALGGVLKQAAKTALPIAGSALGNLIVPGVGGALGGQLASAAGKMFGLELEGLSQEDREFEVARRFVRLAGEATKNAIAAPPAADPRHVAQAAITTAAKAVAPGLAAELGTSTPNSWGYYSQQQQQQQPMGASQSGRWFRQGRRIVIYGA